MKSFTSIQQHCLSNHSPPFVWQAHWRGFPAWLAAAAAPTTAPAAPTAAADAAVDAAAAADAVAADVADAHAADADTVDAVLDAEVCAVFVVPPPT